MDPRRLEMTVLMTPDMANFSGKVHGGALLNLLDRVAFSCASRYSGRYAVTLSVDQVTFKEPINVGELVTFRACGQPRRPHLDGDRHPRRGREHPHRHRPPHQLLLLHHGRRRRRRAAPPRSRALRIDTAAEARRHRAAGLRRGLRREIAAELERAAEGEA